MWPSARLAVLGGSLVVSGACSSSSMSPLGGGGGGGGNVVPVTIQDFSFSPSSQTIKAGMSVQWTNNGPSSHTTTSDNGVWDSGSLTPPSGGYGGGGGASYRFTFATPGTYTYHCKLHPPSIPAYSGFTGTITVTQ